MLAEAQIDQWHRSASIPRREMRDTSARARPRTLTSIPLPRSSKPVAPRVGAILIRAGSRLGGLEASRGGRPLQSTR
jgi:hypothetical protein